MEPFVHDAVQDMRMARDQLERTLDGLTAADLGRYVPYGGRTVHDVIAHLAGADQVWALAAQGLLKGEADLAEPLTPAEAVAARDRAIERGRRQDLAELRAEMERRRRLLLGLFELLEKKHLARKLAPFGESHNSVRERIWLGYHDRLHGADIKRALRMNWYPQPLTFEPAVATAVAALAPEPALYVIFSVDPAWWEKPARGLDWTYRGLLAHIATGDWVLQYHLRHVIETGTVAAWPDVDAGNAERVEERRHSPDHALTEEFLSQRHETLRLIAALRPEHLELPISYWWEPQPNVYTILQYVEMFHVHERRHIEQLRPAMKYATSPRA